MSNESDSLRTGVGREAPDFELPDIIMNTHKTIEARSLYSHSFQPRNLQCVHRRCVVSEIL